MSITGGWLAIELHGGGARAVVAWPDATVVVLPDVAPVDGAGIASRSAGALAAAWDTGGRGGPLAGPQLVELFGRVRLAAQRAADGVPGSVTVVVPAGWGARQLPVVRQAAAAAGFGAVEVMPAAVAVGWHLLAGGVWLEPGASVLVCGVDGGCAATVLRRSAEGFEVLAAVDGATVAAELADTAEASGSDLIREVARRAMVGAQVPPGMFDLVCAVGPDADAGVGRLLTQVCAAEPMLVAEPQLAAVLGAVQRGPVPGSVEVSADGGVPWRDLVGVALAVVASLGLFSQFLAGGQRYGPREKLTVGMVLAPWGELAFAAVFGLVAVAGGLVLAVTAQHRPADPGDAGGVGWVRGRVEAVALVAAAAGGLVWAAGYALLAASYFDADIGGFLRWSVLPLVPGVVALCVLAVVVWRRATPPAGSWAQWLRFPAAAVVLAGVGAALIGWDETGLPWLLRPLAWRLYQWMPDGQTTIIGPVGRLGGALVGVAVVLLAVRRPLLRLLFGVPAGVLVAAMLSWRVTGALAVGFALAVAAWWAMRAAVPMLRPLLLRPTASSPPQPNVPGLGASADGLPGAPYGGPRGHHPGSWSGAVHGGWGGDGVGPR
ncbi:hypothetical protein [Dactylosporangium sp. CA-139066]|uniref:hypothetical protein n=1 Tax=Dactylosporangium sp. CA-139066 TaxID=3239930 RepID=UPI003D8C5C0B